MDKINRSNETGTLYPKANITAIPRHYFRESLTRKVYPENDLRICIRDAFVAEKDYIKSGFMIFEFTCSEIPYKILESICKNLCEKEFISLKGQVVLRHNDNAKKFRSSV